MLEQLVTYGVVACAAAYATWRLIPGRLRLALAEGVARLAQHLGLPESSAAALRRRAADSGKACGGCSGCAGKKSNATVQIMIKKKES